MTSRIQTAFQKLIFCWRVTANPGSFLRLIVNTKRWRWYKDHASRRPRSESASAYQLCFGDQRLNLFLRTRSGDLDIFYEIFWLLVYELPRADMANFRVIIDVGSNVGLSIQYFLQHAPNATVIGVEPETENFNLLVKNCAAAIATGRVVALQAAVLESEGYASLTIPSIKYNTRVSEFETGNSIKSISMASLFKKMDIKRVDLLKIDVEGSERAIFSGDLSWLELVNHILIEIHDEESRQFCFDILKQNYFEVGGPMRNDFSQSVFFAKRSAL